jgi:hypothetical protein
MKKRTREYVMNNKKVGIITFHRAHNCGSILESFAMQKTLTNLRYDAELINFSSNGQRDMYRVLSRKLSIKSMIKNILILPFLVRVKRHYCNYDEFINKNLKVSEGDYSSEDELRAVGDKYDIYLAGSDQIWNITIPDYDISYFLSFTNKKKIAYAPSFGAKNILEYAQDPAIYKDLIMKFSDLSTRERNGQKWIYDLTKRKVPVVLDPTLLLERKEYDSLIEDSKVKGDYIFYYSPRYKKNINKFVKRISKKYNLPVIVWNSKDYALKGLYRYGFKMTYKQNPGIYLDLMKNAKLVITTSFHGSIFSTIYRKNFFVIKNGGMYGSDDRVITLLDELKISDRLIEPEFDVNKEYLDDMNYDGFQENLDELKKKSLNYLEKALK